MALAIFIFPFRLFHLSKLFRVWWYQLRALDCIKIRSLGYGVAVLVFPKRNHNGVTSLRIAWRLGKADRFLIASRHFLNQSIFFSLPISRIATWSENVVFFLT